MRNSIAVLAFAKINVGLKILARRSDGYHEIRTVYQTVGLHDRLELTLRPSGKGTRVDCSDPAVPGGRGNLVYGACELWRRARGFRGEIEVHLRKGIPTGSGMGGASSDAAATLLGLERLTGDRLKAPERWALAATLGSDVPLFLWGGSVLGCGRGEEVYPLADLPPRALLVVFPGFAVATAEAYRAASLGLTKRRTAPSINIFGAWSPFPLKRWGPAENDFERVIFARWPELARLKRQLIRAGAETASLTGSGSAVYAVFESSRQLARASKLIPKGWRGFRTRTLSRAEYWRKIFEAVASR
ncbi:MAG: 4-(cytidine 5'-diphospho)-2-C-methyl-D-erythritol kinase [Acidobacteriia bacterium]|nr:4-(cytidine 5'-diphospho)-2-C-methyl-D-erythritol kinase [Terriglobia bacterium]